MKVACVADGYPVEVIHSKLDSVEAAACQYIQTVIKDPKATHAGRNSEATVFLVGEYGVETTVDVSLYWSLECDPMDRDEPPPAATLTRLSDALNGRPAKKSKRSPSKSRRKAR